MLEAGTILQGRYQILKPIGRGGMGAVYLASDQRLGSTVALKETFFNDPVLLAAFKREARLLAGLKHAALPKVIDHFADGDGQFLVMEFIAGDDLEDVLNKRDIPFRPDEALEWTDQLLDALDYLHSQNPPVIHRDIKPQNMKLTSRSQIVLLDFGLAKGAAVGMSITGPTTSVFGYTPSYAPLEQIQGSGTDARSDLYSLAATVYHLLTATKPVDALTRATTVVNGQADPLAPASEVNPHIPDAVSRVLMQAMALKRDERPSSAAEMRCMLRSAFRPATESQATKPRQANTAAQLDPSTEALTIAHRTPNKVTADPITYSPRALTTQKRSAPIGAYRGGNPNRSPVTQAQWQSSAVAFQNQADSSRGKLIAAAVVFIVAIAVIIYALNRRSNAGDANATQTGSNSDAQVKDSNQSDANAKTPAASPSESSSGWPSSIREQASGEEKSSSAGDGDAAREEQEQEPEQAETKRAETGAEPEKTDAAKSRPERGQEEANREDRPPPPPPPPMEHGPPPDHGPPPGGMPPPPPPRRRP
jgi:serine/threonine protein kinase